MEPFTEKHDDPAGVKRTHVDAELINAALRSYLAKSSKPDVWLRHPNNLISVVAITLSILGIVYGFYKDRKESIDKNQQALSAIVTDLTKLDAEALALWQTPATPAATTASNRPSPGSDTDGATKFENARKHEIGRTILNRRLALLSEADRVTAHLGDLAPPSQLALLGTSYWQVNEFEKAKRYFTLVTQETNPPLMRRAGWRMLAIIHMTLGPSHEMFARDAFAKAIEVDPDSKDFASMSRMVDLYLNASDFEFGVRQYARAVEHLAKAKKLASGVPCAMGGQYLTAQIRESLATKATLARQANISLETIASSENMAALQAPGC